MAVPPKSPLGVAGPASQVRGWPSHLQGGEVRPPPVGIFKGWTDHPLLVFQGMVPLSVFLFLFVYCLEYIKKLIFLTLGTCIAL